MSGFTDLVNCLMFDTPAYTYTRPILDGRPYQIIKDSNGKKSTIVFNALGIETKDVKIEIARENEREFLTIAAETKNTKMNRTFNISGRFGISSNEINNIEWEMENGLLYINVYFKEPERPKIPIKNKEQ